MNDAIKTKVNGFISDFTGLGLPPVSVGDEASYLDGQYSVAFNSPTLLSLRFLAEEYVTGGAHPVDYVASLNYVVSTGAVIHLADIFTSSAAALPVLRTQAQTRLTADMGDDLMWPASPPMSFFEKCWVFTSAGLEFTWNQGEVASMAAGAVSVTITWPALHSVVKPSGPAGEFL